jgi:4-aminobutyrate aminotransferase/(S)-3-amino-2-methylpropionate transaminase
MGDPVRTFQLESTVKYILDNKLVENTNITGEYLKKGLLQIEKEHGVFSNTRMVGTYGSVDLPTPQDRDRLVQIIRNNGVLIYMCGEKSIRFRPMLILQPKHAQIILERI